MLTMLEKYVLTYQNIKGVTVCNIPDYYARMIVPLDKKFSNFKLTESSKAICPLHNDHDPSLGILKSKFPSGTFVYHCFGCGATGNVVRLHQRISEKYHNKKISVKDSCLELCSIFDIPVPDLTELADDDYEGIYTRRYNNIENMFNGYTSKDFATDLLQIRKQGVDLNAVNSACVKLIATKKELYS